MLTVAETATSTWHYHLREVGPEGRKPGGGAGPALCGIKLGWDVNMPIPMFMKAKPEYTFNPCSKCRELYRRQHGLVEQSDSSTPS